MLQMHFQMLIYKSNADAMLFMNTKDAARSHVNSIRT